MLRKVLSLAFFLSSDVLKLSVPILRNTKNSISQGRHPKKTEYFCCVIDQKSGRAKPAALA